MKKSIFKRTISIVLVLLMTLSFTACISGDSESSLDSKEVISSQGSEAASEQASEESTQSDSDQSLTSEVSAEQSNESSEDASSEESVSEAEPSSEEASEQSEVPSEDTDTSSETSTGDVSVLNPYYGTTIEPAEGKVIAFTFDDGPSYTSSTNKILDKLEELGMKATFFMVGERVSQKTAPTIQRMVDLGCDIGNHSFDHPNFNTMTISQVQKQINDTNARLEKFVGTKATLIRPPYGNIKDSQMASLNTPIICWDIDSLDWDLRNAQKIYDRTIEKVHSGGIVLMHDIYDTTADAFCMLADKLVADGYTLVSVSELLGTEKLMCTTIKYGFKW